MVTVNVTIFLALLSAVFATNVNKCKNQPYPSEVRIKGCNQQPCTFVKGTTANIQVDFKTDFPIQHLTTKVRAKFMGLSFKYPLPEKQSATCNYLSNGSHCPLVEGRDITNNFDFPISKSYPSFRSKVEVSLVDGAGRVVTCFGADIKLTSG